MYEHDLEHPDIASAQRTGWACGAGENRDTPETRREFAGENIEALLDFIEAGDAGLLERFVEHYGWKYRNWLN